MSGATRKIILEKLADIKVARIILNRPDKHNALDQEMMEQYLAALEEVRNDDAIRVVVSKANGPSFGSGLDLFWLRESSRQPPSIDWDRASLPKTLCETLRNFPKVTIAQVHGYCLGHAFVDMCSHDLAYAAESAQIGMPEIMRGSFGQMATSNLFHAGVPMKKAAHIQLTGQFASGIEADRLGLVSRAVPDAELEAYTLKIATELATRHPGALASAKLAVRMGTKLGLADSISMDQLVAAWQQQMTDPVAHVEDYLKSQVGGTNLGYRRPDA